MDVFALAARLHKTAGEIAQMSASEFEHWRAFFRLEKKQGEPQS